MPEGKEAKRRHDAFRLDKRRKGVRGTFTTPSGKVRAPKSVTSARKARAVIARAAGVDEKTLAVLTNDEIKARIGMNSADIAKLNGIASGLDVPRNSVSIIGAQKLKLSVAGLLQQQVNVKADVGFAALVLAAGRPPEIAKLPPEVAVPTQIPAQGQTYVMRDEG